MLSPLRTMGKRVRALLTSRQQPITHKPKIDLELLEDRIVPDSRSLLLQIAPTALSAFSPAAQYAAQFKATALPNVSRVDGSTATLNDLAAKLAGTAGVSMVEYDQTVHAALAPNDPAYSNGTLWGLSGTYGINAPSAWNNTIGSSKV